MRIICEVCKQEGQLQQLGNYYRVRHYEGKGENGKVKFSYHQQTKVWVESQLNSKDSSGDQLNTDAGQTNPLSVQNLVRDDCNNIKSSIDIGNTSNIEGGRRLVWFRTLAFQANDPGFKSRRPHLDRTMIQVRILLNNFPRKKQVSFNLLSESYSSKILVDFSTNQKKEEIEIEAHALLSMRTTSFVKFLCS